MSPVLVQMERMLALVEVNLEPSCGAPHMYRVTHGESEQGAALLFLKESDKGYPQRRAGPWQMFPNCVRGR